MKFRFNHLLRTNNLSRALLCTVIIILSLLVKPALAESQKEQIKATLNDYIQGTSYNYPDRILNAFNADAKLLLEKKDVELFEVSAKKYASWFKNDNAGKFSGRIGEILQIEVSGNVASAKVEILLPERKRRYVDLFLLKKLSNKWKIISKTAASDESNQHGKRVLFIVSNALFHGTTKLPAGASFSEIVNAYDEFKKAGFTIDFVSPNGGAAPLSFINTSDELQKQYLYNADFMYAIGNTRTPAEIEPENYRAVQYIGGSNAMYGVAENPAIQKISMDIYENHNGIISSVCHGTAGIAFLKLKNGEYLVKGKRISGYPDEYEAKDREYFKEFPFHITKTVEQHGGDFRISPRGTAHVEVDGRVITGQNHLSSALVAKKMIELIKLEK